VGGFDVEGGRVGATVEGDESCVGFIGVAADEKLHASAAISKVIKKTAADDLRFLLNALR